MESEPKLIKVRLTNQGADSETPWAEDLGPAEGVVGGRLVRLENVPFLHAKPTLDDVIVVTPASDDFVPSAVTKAEDDDDDDEGEGGDGDDEEEDDDEDDANLLTWDRGGVPWNQIGQRIHTDGGRWAMIVDYATHKGTSVDDAFEALSTAGDALGVVVEGAWQPRDNEPGRVYLAVTREHDDRAVMAHLVAAKLPITLIQIHPEPLPADATAAPAPGEETATTTDVTVEARPVAKAAKPAAAKADKPAKAAKPAKPAKPTKPAAKKAAPAQAPAKPKAKPAPAKAKPAPAAKAKPAAAKANAKPAAKPAKKR